MAQIETLAAGLTHASRAETSYLNLRGDDNGVERRTGE